MRVAQLGRTISGSRGIGRATAVLLARRGARVVVAGRDAGRGAGRGAEAVAEATRAGADATFVAMDVADAASMGDAVARAAAAYGRLDVVVANAGIEQPHTLPAAQLSEADMHQVIDTNLKGAWLTLHHALPRVARPGAVCLVSSLWGTLGGAGLSAYTATKGGINAMTRALAVELGPEGVRVNCVSPGAIDTPMLQRYSQGADLSAFYKANVPLGRAGRAEEVAEAIVWVCSDAASYVTGQVLAADGGITSKMPGGTG